MNKYEDTSTMQAPAQDAGRHLHSIERQVITPLYNSIVAGLVVAALMAVAGWYAWREAWVPVSLVFFILAFAAWWWLEHNDLRNLTARLELMTGVNLDPDPRIGNELSRRVRIYTPEIDDNTLQPTGSVNVAHFENDLKVYNVIYAHKVKKINFSEIAMLKEGVVTPGEWKEILAEMMKNKWVKWTNPNAHTSGLTIRPAGEAAFQHYLDNPPFTVEA